MPQTFPPGYDPFDGEDSLVARVQIPIPLPAKDEILQALREQIPQVLKADVHAEITKLYTKGTFESIVEAAATAAFNKWLTEPDRATGLTREQMIIDRFHYFMTEAVAGPRTRQDYLVKILLNAYPDLAKKLAEAQPIPHPAVTPELHAQVSVMAKEAVDRHLGDIRHVLQALLDAK